MRSPLNLCIILTDLGEGEQIILKQFLPANSNFPLAKFQIDEAKFAQHCRENLWIPTDTEDYLQWLARVSTALLNVVASRENYLPHLAVVSKLKVILLINCELLLKNGYDDRKERVTAMNLCAIDTYMQRW